MFQQWIVHEKVASIYLQVLFASNTDILMVEAGTCFHYLKKHRHSSESFCICPCLSASFVIFSSSICSLVFSYVRLSLFLCGKAVASRHLNGAFLRHFKCNPSYQMLFISPYNCSSIQIYLCRLIIIIIIIIIIKSALWPRECRACGVVQSTPTSSLLFL